MVRYVSVSSHSPTLLRRIPQQMRGRRRVDGFLCAAAALITELGYERTTMSAIAKRARSSIGSLYQFFPDKKSVAEALRAQYIGDIERYWMALAKESHLLSSKELASRLVSLQLEIVGKYPALLGLLDVPPGKTGSKRRELIRTRIAEVLTSHKPHLTRISALRMASTLQQVSRAMLMLYAQAEPSERPAIVAEFKCVLEGYLVPKLNG